MEIAFLFGSSLVYYFAKKFTPLKKILVIGDVHGCIEELKELIAMNSDRDEIYCVGDLVNKGPKSMEVVRYCMQYPIFCIMGNHDDSLVRYLLKGVGNQFVNFEDVSEDEFHFLQSLPLHRRVAEHNLLLVHAGIIPNLAIDFQEKRNLINMRDLLEDGTATSVGGNLGGNRPWGVYYSGPEHVVFGHDAKRGLQQHKWCTGLDTGCCYGNELTGLLYPEKKIISVKAKKMYAPPTSL